jgi:hypothetical protein
LRETLVRKDLPEPGKSPVTVDLIDGGKVIYREVNDSGGRAARPHPIRRQHGEKHLRPCFQGAREGFLALCELPGHIPRQRQFVRNKLDLDEVDDPVAALSKIRGPESTNMFGEKVVFLFRDLHPFFGVPKIARLIRDIAREFKTAKKTLIMISPLNELPVGLQRDVTLLEFGLPERAIIGTMIDRFVTENKTVVGDVAKDEVFAIVEACMGLTTVEAENVTT